jgi:hypothetical protein
MPVAVNAASNAALNFVSRSRSSNLDGLGPPVEVHEQVAAHLRHP